MHTYIGCSGWVYKDWKGTFYPSSLSEKNWLSYYSNIFETVEINSSFYHMPSESTLKSWYHKVPSHFKYAIKASRVITHLKRFKETRELIKIFYGFKDILSEKLEYFLFQLPPTYFYTPEALDRLISSLDPRYKNVIEFRHDSWWQEEVFKIFERQDILFCSVKGLNLPDSLILMNGKFYVRLHGESSPNYFFYRYSRSELSGIVQTLQAVRERLKEGWIYFNNDAHGNAPANARELKELFQQQKSFF